MKKIFISGAVLTVIVLISYFLIADCLDIWDGKGQFVDMIWEASP